MAIEIGYIPGPKLGRMLCNAKDKIDALESGVYVAPCGGCVFKYIGETGRHFKVRIQEHENDVRRKNKKSPVALHMMENEHQIDVSNCKLIIKEPRTYHRKFKEALIIRSTNHKMNTSKGAQVNPIWSATLVRFLKKL